MAENIDIMLDLSQPDNVRRAQMALVGRKGFHHFVVKQAKGTASQLQRGYYFTVVMGAYALYLRDYCGWDVRNADDAHDVCKLTFLGRTVTNREGRTRTIPGSTAGMTTAEMADHIDAVRRLMDEAGYVTPDPDERWREKATAAPSSSSTAA
jgi:hypothetical protein